MTQVLYPEWRDEQEPTNYPFGDQATLVNAAGDTLLAGTLLDAHLYPIGGKEGIYLSQVDINFSTVTVTIGDKYNDNLASGSFRLTAPGNLIKLRDAYGRPAGVLVSESIRLAIMQSWGIGLHVFTPDQTEFAASCCMPTPEIGVRGVVLEDGSLFTGQVFIVGSDGVVISKEEVIMPVRCGQASQLVPVIRVDVVGDPLFRRRLCTPHTLFVTPNPVRKIRVINGDRIYECVPDQLGNLTIQMNDNLASDTALRVHQTPEGLIIEAVGSKTTQDATT